MIDRAAVVLPQPLSPASPRLSPSPKVKSTPSTARTVPSCVWKCVLRPFTVRSGMLPLRGMVRTSSGTRFSERGSRTPGSALTFSQTHTRSSASYKGDGAFAVDEARGILRFADARPSLLRVPDRLVVRDLDPVLGAVDPRPPVLRLRIHPRRRRLLGRAPRVPTSRRRRRGPNAPATDDHPERIVPLRGHPGLRPQRDLLGLRRREGVALLIGVEVFLGVTLYVMAVFRPLYLQALGLSESAIAISISGFLLVAAIWSAFAGTITRVLGEFGTLALLVLMASAAFFGMYGAGRFPGAALLQVPLYIVWSLQPALTTAFLNRRLEPGQRATVLSMGAFAYTVGLVVVEPLAGALTTTTGLLNLGLFLGIVTFFPCAYILARWRTTVAAWPAVTPLPSRLIAGSRVSRFHRLLERMSRLRP